MKKYLFVIIGLMSFFCWTKTSWAQEGDIVIWDFSAQRVDQQTVEVTYKAQIVQDGWHFWTVDLDNEMLIPTEIMLKGIADHQKGALELSLGDIVEREDEIFGFISYYEGAEIILQQKIKTDPSMTEIKGELTFQACNASMCVAPKTVSIDLKL